jgi:ribonuclease BN (tRNA processing enzyme)
MELMILGRGPSFANPGGASSGYLVSANSSCLLVDCGHGVLGKLQEYSNLRGLSAIVISHLHPDHFFDLVPLKYSFFFQSISPIPLWLPPGGKDVLGRLQAAVGLDDTFFTQSFAVAEYDPSRPLELRDVEVRFAATQHFIPGNAMRFRTESTDRELFFSADTGWVSSVLELARGSALALVEASILSETHMESPAGHLSGRQAGELAREAGVQRLVLTHYYQPTAEQLLADARESFGPEVYLAEEGKRFPV